MNISTTTTTVSNHRTPLSSIFTTSKFPIKPSSVGYTLTNSTHSSSIIVLASSSSSSYNTGDYKGSGGGGGGGLDVSPAKKLRELLDTPGVHQGPAVFNALSAKLKILCPQSLLLVFPPPKPSGLSFGSDVPGLTFILVPVSGHFPGDPKMNGKLGATTENYVSISDDDTFPLHKFSLTLPNSLKDASVVSLSHGLLCLYGYYKNRCHGNEMVLLWNLSARRCIGIVIPNVIYFPHGFTRIGFGVCPDTNDPKLVKINNPCKRNLDWDVE
nr:hypothetical protein [Tanacetum cinerariifolium]